jgi:hypothetical protein
MRLARTPNPIPTPYIAGMPKYEFCIPTAGKAVPSGAEWFHEIKYDGYRLRVERDGHNVRLITRGGNDWTKRFPWIAQAALTNRRKQFVVDGEAVILGVDGLSGLNALHSGRSNSEVHWTVTTCETFRYRCARRTLRDFSAAGPTAFSSTHSRPAPSAPTYSKRPARWGWRDWYQSGVTGLTVADDRHTGSR